MGIANNEMFKPDQQWININISSNQGDYKPSLIDTFTADLDKKNDNDTYKVSGNVGSLIAQKLSHGEKMRICRNGQPVQNHSFIQNLNDSNLSIVNQQNNK